MSGVAEPAARARGDLAQEMLPVAARLSVLVHGDGGPQDVGALLAGLGEQERVGLLVVLAGLVDPDRPLGAVLGWLDFDEEGRPVVPDREDRTTLRQIAEDAEEAADVSAGEYVDEAAVLAYLAGRRVSVSAAERLEAIERGVRRGMTYRDFDRMHGLRSKGTSNFMLRVRRQQAAQAAAVGGSGAELGRVA